MTVASETSKVIYSGNGSTTVFSTVFAFLNSVDVKVVLTSTASVETNLSISTHYTLSGGSGAVGNVTMITAPASGEKLTIYREPPITQVTDYVNGDSFDAESHERALDKLTQIMQSINEKNTRAVKLPVSSSFSSEIIPTANKVIGFNSTATAIEYYLPNADFSEINSATTISQLRSTVPTSDGQIIALVGHTTAGIGGGLFRYDASDTTTADDDGLTIVTSGGKRWKRVLTDTINPSFYGAIGNGTVDCTTAFQKCFDFFASNNFPLSISIDSGVFRLKSTLITPAGVKVKGSGRHPWFKEYGDTTSGVAHPKKGTVLLFESGTATARVWTDINGSDSAITPAIIFLGESQTWADLTVQVDGMTWHSNIFIAGCSSHNLDRVDVRGGALHGVYFDGTWGLSNTVLTTKNYLPTWFNASIYDYGLTNIKWNDSFISGINAVTVKGTSRTGVSTWVYAPNGISDTSFSDCLFFNEGDNTTRKTSSLINFDFRVGNTTSAQGLAFHSCRFDVASLWFLNVNWGSDISLTGGRTFCETSQVWQDYQISEGATTAEQRGRINVSTSNTGLIILQGEFFANLAKDSSGDDFLKNHRYRNINGSKIIYIGNDGGFSISGFFSSGETGSENVEIQSYKSGGGIDFVNLNGGGVETYATISTTEGLDFNDIDARISRNGISQFKSNGNNSFIETLKTDSTASGANVNVNTSTGNIRYSTSTGLLKKDIENMSDESALSLLDARAVWYRSLCDSDNQDYSWYGLIAEELEKIDPRYVFYTENENGKTASGIDYARLVVPLLKLVQILYKKIDGGKDA